MPTTSLQLYDGNGMPTRRVPSPVEPTEQEQPIQTEHDNSICPINEELSTEGDCERSEYEEADWTELAPCTTSKSKGTVSKATVCEPQHSEPKDCYLTKHATAIAEVIGDNSNIREMDTVRHRLKTNNKMSAEDKITHTRLMLKLQLTVQRERRAVVAMLESYHKQYFVEHGQLPSNEASQEYAALTRKCRHINKLLQIWNTEQ